MRNKLLTFIREQNMVQPGDTVICAVSGGADSMALLWAMYLLKEKLGIRLEAAHFNHNLRGEESKQDAEFVRKFCEFHDIPLHFGEGNVIPGKKGLGAAARDARYAFLRSLDGIIATAHTADDNAETMLLNLTRGTGIRGLTGMSQQHKHIVRPMLMLTRQEVENFLKEEGIGFVTDHTNTDTRFRRNKIRHEVLPLLRSLNPSVDQSIADTMRHLSGTAALADYAVHQLRDRICQKAGTGIDIDQTAWQHLPLPAEGREALLHELLAPYRFSPILSDILKSFDREPGAVFENHEYIATHTHKGLSIRRKPTRFVAMPLPESGTVILPDGTRLRLLSLERNELQDIPRSANTACIDADKVTSELLCRSTTKGDRFRPFGMHGTKLVSDYLTDRKRSRIDKMAAQVVCDGAHIAWLIGERIDDRYAITADTRRVIIIRAENPDEMEQTQ